MTPETTYRRARDALTNARAARIADMVRRFERGETLADVGRAYGLSRERVRQLVKGAGVTMPRDGRFRVEICLVGGCERPHKARGYCSMHGTRIRTHGSLISPARVLQGHGTQASYARGCRCEECTDANRRKLRADRHRRSPEMGWRTWAHPEEIPPDARRC